MKNKLEKFGKFEVVKNEANNITGGTWYCYASGTSGGPGHLVGIYQSTEVAIVAADVFGATCMQEPVSTIKD